MQHFAVAHSIKLRAGHEAGHPGAGVGRQNHGGLGGEALLDSAPQAVFCSFYYE